MYDEQATFGAILLLIAAGTFIGMLLHSYFGKKENLLWGEVLEEEEPVPDYVWPEGQSFMGGVRYPLHQRVKVINVVDLLSLLCIFGLVALTWVVRGRPQEASDGLTNIALLSAMAMQVFFAVVPMMIICFRMNVLDFFGIRWRGIRHIVWLAVLGCLVTYALFFLIEISNYKELIVSCFGQEIEQETVKFLKDPETTMSSFWLMAAVAVIFAPLGEEFLFRGYVYPVMRKYGSPLFGMIFSGLLFSLFHFNMYALLPLFVFGVVLAFLYEKSGSIWLPMAAHALFNSVGVIASYAVKVGKFSGLE